MSPSEPDSHINRTSHCSDNELQNVDKYSILSASVGIQWQGFDCLFADWVYIPAMNLYRDYLPAPLEMKLTGASKGELIQHQFAAGELVDTWQPSLHMEVPRESFQPPHTGVIPITPAAGRFYPQEFFHPVAGIYLGNRYPCRITEIMNSHFKVDFNHPLAGKVIHMMIRIESIRKAGAERGGRCNDIPAIVCDLGPGMQDRLEYSDTDFWSDNCFARIDDSEDGIFFKQPRLSPFWDKLALQQVSDFYAEHIRPQSHILDLMAGVHSPLQESGIRPASVTAAGLNKQELDHNPVVSRSVVLDVNSMDGLPFTDQEFDVVLIHAAIEYVINPNQLMAEISRVLKPAGKIIISFSNRSVIQKTIQLWSGALKFERPGIILSYLRSTGNFGHFTSYSKRGIIRPEDDELAHRLVYSDPVFIIKGEKI